MSLIGERLAEERVRLGLKQDDVALLCGVSRVMVGQYERGQAMPKADVLMALMGHGFDVNYVVGGSRNATATTLTRDEQDLLDQYRALDIEGKAATIRGVRMEALRSAAPAADHAFKVREPSPPLTLHEPSKAPVKPPSKKPKSPPR